jgi:2-C-methyl-D-erythritol 4-phosphate cytidylyltransferase
MDAVALPIWAVLPAAGVGKRMAASIPKQYLTLQHKTVIEHSLRAVCDHPRVEGAIVALGSDDQHWDTLSITLAKPLFSCVGGEERCHSVFNALDYLLSGHARAEDWVMVHDAARPCLRREDVAKLIEAVENAEAAGGILALPISDTVKRSNIEHRVEATVDRNGLWRALTPQMFRLGELRNALQLALTGGLLVTDESAAMELRGVKPLLVEGCADNLKITRPDDLILAEFHLQKRDTSCA